jgi:nitroimidazol reductase NimA-like FMN-containing flavoprotein (pyridoxamine 5'-phosphate oxidase superfamily)
MAGIDDDVEALIRDKPLVATLSTSVDDRPHAVPVWYHYRDGCVRFTSTEGNRRNENVRNNERVAVSIERSVDGIPIWMALLRGRGTVRDDADTVLEYTPKIYEKYMGDRAAWDEFYRYRVDEPPDETGVRIIEVDVGSATRHFTTGADPDDYLTRQLM